tara:strand:- start:10285 stop:11199 length:915 start_codon:yes stop_codon:yes gene_type:complete
MNKNPYKILGVTKNSSIDEIKKMYKKIALECHPDKTLNESENIRDIMNIKFKEATEAYKLLTNNPNIDYNNYWDSYDFTSNYEENYNYNDWINIFSDFVHTNDDAKNYISNIAKVFRDNNIIKNKKFYKFTKIPIIHKITLNVSYKELITNTKKKLRLLLKDIDEPVYISINCLDSFPFIDKIYIDDDDVTHEINIKIKIIKCKDFIYKIVDNKINIYYKIKYNLYDYLNGYKTHIKYIDDTYLDIDIPEFISKRYEIENRGINGGSLFIKIKFNNKKINNKYWNELDNNEKESFNRLLFNILN